MEEKGQQQVGNLQVKDSFSLPYALYRTCTANAVQALMVELHEGAMNEQGDGCDLLAAEGVAVKL